MPDVKVVCPSCSTVLELSNGMQLGSKTRCPQCRGVVVVPQGAPAAKKAKKPVGAETTKAESPEEKKKTRPAGAKPPAKSLSPRALAGVVLLVLLAAGVAVGGYFARNWLRPARANPIDGPRGSVLAQAAAYPTPDAVLDAYVQSLKDADISACKKTMTRGRLQHDEDYHRSKVKDPEAPDGMEKQWHNVMRFYRTKEWKDGQFKRFPVEMQGPDKAIIVCIFPNKRQKKDEYRKYVFVRMGRGFLQTDWETGDAKDLDATKYPYAWEKPKPPDKPAPPG